MSDQLSIANLLSLLNIDRRNDAVRLCEEAESLRRRKYYEKAVEAGLHAERIARRAFDYELHGTTLLYLGVMYAFRNAPADSELACRNCDRAVRAFGLDSHNHVVSQLVRAQIKLHLKQADEAIVHFYSTRQALQELIFLSRELKRNQMVTLYESLYEATNVTIARVYASLTEVKAMPIARKRMRPADIQATDHPHVTYKQTSKESLPVPMQIVWPTPTSIRLDLSPVYVSLTDKSIDQSNLSNSTLDYIKLSEVSIHGKPFAVQSVYPISGEPDNTFKIYQGKQYVPVLIQSDEEKGKYSDTYMLIRRQDCPDHEDQYIVINDLGDKHAWVDRADRQWNFQHEWEENSPDNKEPHVIGIVEAWLKPLT